MVKVTAENAINIINLEDAVEQQQEALLALLTAQRELGWRLARERLEKEGKSGFLLDDEKEV